MSEILVTKFYNDKEIYEKCIFEYKVFIKNLLNDKGGESYSFTIINTSTNEVFTEYCSNKEDYDIIWDKFENKILKLKENWSKVNKIEIVLFSRQVFDTDNFEEVKPDPYLENNKYVWFSGSITNLDEIEKALGKKFTVPSQAVAYHDVLLDKNIIIKGIFTAFVYNRKFKKGYWLHNGIPIWVASYEYTTSNNRKIIIEWSGTNREIDYLTPGTYKNIETKNKLPYYLLRYTSSYDVEIIYEKTKFHSYILFSGGLDSVLSSYGFIKKYILDVKGNFYTYNIGGKPRNNNKFIFIYFDYGSKTREQEIAALKKFYKFIKKEAPNFEYEYRIIDVKEFFNGYKNTLVKNLDIINTDNYLPYQNTGLIMLLGNIIDKDLEKEIFFPFVIFGSNLTKSKTYLEYGHAWERAIEFVLNYGGSSYKRVDFVIPFENLNIQNMMIYVIKHFGFDKTKELLDIVYSCVDPNKNGEPCGKCIKCINREKAFKEAVLYIKKEFFKKN